MITRMDDEPKSALELAMARLRRQDSEAGVTERTLSAEQKAEIAAVRQSYAAKIAQEEILHAPRVAGLIDPEERRRIDEGYHRDVQRLNDERDRKIEKIRNA